MYSLLCNNSNHGRRNFRGKRDRGLRNVDRQMGEMVTRRERMAMWIDRMMALGVAWPQRTTQVWRLDVV